jgi:hypothetical protein
MNDQFKNNEAAESEDLFDFPEVQGFSSDFIEAARLQTEAANSNDIDTAPAFEKHDNDDFIDDFADDFSDLMGEPLEEAPQEEEVEVSEPAVAVETTASEGGLNFHYVWAALSVLFAVNIIWAWSWHSSENRLRGEMDQRFQSLLVQQKSQTAGGLEDSTTVEIARTDEWTARVDVDEASALSETMNTLESIKGDLMHSRYETARARAWRLIGRVDSLPVNKRAQIEASARLLIAESYEVRSAATQEGSR